MIMHDARPCEHAWVRWENGRGALMGWQCRMCTKSVEAGGHLCLVCKEPAPPHRDTCCKECNTELRRAWATAKKVGGYRASDDGRCVPHGG